LNVIDFILTKDKKILAKEIYECDTNFILERNKEGIYSFFSIDLNEIDKFLNKNFD
jgi:hypothetical protein